MKKKRMIRSTRPNLCKLILLLTAVCLITTNCDKDDPPVADFTGSPTIIIPPQTVQFTDQSAFAPTSWSWNFGDGETSTLQNPSHTYLIDGTYTVELTVTNDVGSDTRVYTDYIKVSEIFFNPDLTYGKVTDIDGNTYLTIKIGTQTWMAENLKTTRNNDGTYISYVHDDYEWASLSSPAYCWYDNDEGTYKSTYGALYNGFAGSTAINGGKNICPAGWHVPSRDEYETLVDYLGGVNVAGEKLRESGTTHWNSPNIGATNQTGFSALPGGARTHTFPTNAFVENGEVGFWWSSTADDYAGMYMAMSATDPDAFLEGIKNTAGFSVRCIKDN